MRSKKHQHPQYEIHCIKVLNLLVTHLMLRMNGQYTYILYVINNHSIYCGYKILLMLFIVESISLLLLTFDILSCFIAFCRDKIAFKRDFKFCQVLIMPFEFSFGVDKKWEILC